MKQTSWVLPSLALGLGACLAPPPQAVVVIPPGAIDTEAEASSAPTGAERPAIVRWGEPRTTDDCFFFSGPAGVGRDSKLGTHAVLSMDRDTVRLAFADGATFIGAARAGRVTLERRTTHHFKGAWVVTEHIVGELHGPRLDAEYAYEECEEGGACPGRCAIGADLQIQLP